MCLVVITTIKIKCSIIEHCFVLPNKLTVPTEILNLQIQQIQRLYTLDEIEFSGQNFEKSGHVTFMLI